jgi:hypothetical protein
VATRIAKAKVAGSNPVFRSNQAWNQVVTLSPGLSFARLCKAKGVGSRPSPKITEVSSCFCGGVRSCRALRRWQVSPASVTAPEWRPSMSSAPPNGLPSRASLLRPLREQQRPTLAQLERPMVDEAYAPTVCQPTCARSRPLRPAHHIAHRSAAVCTGASQKRTSSSSRRASVKEQPAISSEVT